MKTKKQLTTKEQAIELISKIEMELTDHKIYRGTIKKLALISVDTVIDSECLHYPEDRLYWKSVRKEIELMH